MSALRCRYSDCIKGNPVARDDEQVTCPTCRGFLGLPPIEDASPETPKRVVKHTTCDHCGTYGLCAAVWTRPVPMEFKWLCVKDEALTHW